MYLIVAVDGPSGTGKTTLINLLGKSNNFLVIGVSSNKLLPELNEYFRENKDQILPKAIYYLMLDKHIEGEAIMDNHAEKGKIVLLDRYRYSALASLLAYDNVYLRSKYKSELIRLFNLVKNDFLKPDLAVFLYADPKTRIKRIKQRGSEGHNHLYRSVKVPMLLNRYTYEFRRIERAVKISGVKVLEIDTTLLQPNDVASIVRKTINQHYKKRI